MSHIVTIETEVRDDAAVRAACQRLGLPTPVQGKTKLFSGEVQGLAVQLPGWEYAVVADLATGQLRYDNFGGRWGDQQHLDRFLQAYACERAKAEARRRGHAVTEQQLADGSICRGLRPAARAGVRAARRDSPKRIVRRVRIVRNTRALPRTLCTRMPFDDALRPGGRRESPNSRPARRRGSRRGRFSC